MSFKDQISEFINKIIKPTIRNFIAIGSFIIIVTQLIAILLEKKIIVPEEYRSLTIEGALSLIILSLIYYWVRWKINTKVGFIIETIKSLEKAKDPTNDIEKNLTNRDVEFAIYCLIKKLVHSNFLIYTDNKRKKFDTEKNIIIGIDRGGAIVGGLLGKGLRLAVKTLGVFYANPPLTDQGETTAIQSSKCLENIDFSRVKKIVLVDDAIRTGQSIEAAVRVLEDKKRTHNFEYKIVCILNVPYVRGRYVNPDFFVYKTHDIDLKLPWDVHWDTTQQNIEFDELCNKI